MRCFLSNTRSWLKGGLGIMALGKQALQPMGSSLIKMTMMIRLVRRPCIMDHGLFLNILTGLFLVTHRCHLYCRYCFRPAILALLIPANKRFKRRSTTSTMVAIKSAS